MSDYVTVYEVWVRDGKSWTCRWRTLADGSPLPPPPLEWRILLATQVRGRP